MKTIAVRLFAGRGYFVKVGVSLKSLGQNLRSFGLSRTMVVVSDRRVARRHSAALVGGLKRAGFVPHLAVIKNGESNKNLRTVQALYGECLRARLDRRSAVIALGGGVVGDVAGFVAATYLRGLPLIQCPTSLLAMVDSSIGGKVGVDLPEGKNLVGAFWQPREVWMDLSVLKTLPEREWRTGMAEVVKYGLLADPDMVTILEETDLTKLRRHPTLLEDIVTRTASIKARIVSQDENDTRGQRELLNLGHTFGHAIESVTGYRAYTHGEAIAIGMCAAARLSACVRAFPFAYVRRLEALFGRWGLPCHVDHPLPRARILKAMSRDKKTYSGKVRFVIPVRWGKAETVRDVPVSALNRVLSEVGL